MTVFFLQDCHVLWYFYICFCLTLSVGQHQVSIPGLPAPLQVPWRQGLFSCSLFLTERCKGRRQLSIWCFHFLCSRDVRTRGTLVIIRSTSVFNERIQCVKWLIPIVQVISDFPRARNRSHLLTHDLMGEAWSDEVRQTPFNLPPSHADTETTCLGFLILRLPDNLLYLAGI